MLKRLLFSLAVALVPAMAGAQTVTQGGSWTAGLPPVYSTSGLTSPIVQQAGPASGTGVGIKELSIIARGTGSAPFAGQGSGQMGTVVQIQDAPSTNSGGYHALSLSANAGGGGLITYNALGGAAPLPLNLNVNGTTYQFPFALSGIVGPSTTTIGNLSCWNNGVGTLLSDCGAGIGTSGAKVPLLNGANTWSGIQIFDSGDFKLAGSGSGTTILNASSAASGTLTLPATTDTLVTRNLSETLANKTLTSPVISTISNTGIITLPTTTTTLVGQNTTDTLTHKTYDTAGAGNIFKIGGQQLTDTTGANTTVLTGGSQINNVLGSPVLLNNTGAFFHGPTVAQGPQGTWFASGTVTITDSAGAANVVCKLWDGITIIASGSSRVAAAGAAVTVSLSGFLDTPAGNLRISCIDVTSTSGAILDTSGSATNLSTIWAFRIN